MSGLRKAFMAPIQASVHASNKFPPDPSNTCTDTFTCQTYECACVCIMYMCVPYPPYPFKPTFSPPIMHKLSRSKASLLRIVFSRYRVTSEWDSSLVSVMSVLNIKKPSRGLSGKGAVISPVAEAQMRFSPHCTSHMLLVSDRDSCMFMALNSCNALPSRRSPSVSNAWRMKA